MQEKLKKLPGKKYTCPSCCRTVTIERGKIEADCPCGEFVFRPRFEEM